MIDDDTASRFTQVFRNHLAPTYPLVKLSGDMSWKRLRNEMPSLFRAILTAAASSSDPKLFKALFHHTAKYLADEVVVHGRKTLDLVQALLIMAIWHYPAEQFNELKFSTWTNTVCRM
jgi:hypothetical protein